MAAAIIMPAVTCVSSPARIWKSRAAWLRESAEMLGFLLPLQAQGLLDNTAKAEKGKQEDETQVILWLCVQPSCPSPGCAGPVPPPWHFLLQCSQVPVPMAFPLPWVCCGSLLCFLSLRQPLSLGHSWGVRRLPLASGFYYCGTYPKVIKVALKQKTQTEQKNSTRKSSKQFYCFIASLLLSTHKSWVIFTDVNNQVSGLAVYRATLLK